MNRKPVRGLKAALITGSVAATVSAATLPAAAAVNAQPAPTTPAATPAAATHKRTTRVMAHELEWWKSRLAHLRARQQQRYRAHLRRQRALSGSPEAAARYLLRERGWSDSQWSCLDALWGRESRWSVTAENASSGAYGIPQAMPGEKMATRGADWRSNAVTQIQWGLDYISAKYGSPCAADQYSLSYGYY